jgi:regulator of sigma E protease
MKGDMIVSIQGKEINGWLEIKEAVQDKAGIPVDIVVKRSDQLITLRVVPEESKQEIYGQEIKAGLIGVLSSGKVKKIEFGPWGAMKEATMETYRWIERICRVIVKLFQGHYSIKTLGGPLMIGQMTGEMAQESLSLLIPFTAIISINLGILNLFPIPILDGGLIIFLLVELLIGRPISLRKRDLAQKVGLFLLVLLMVVVTFNDIGRNEFLRRLVEKVFG